MPIHLPAEWTPHRVLWSAWPSDETLWQEDMAGARAEAAAFFKAVMDDGAGEPVHVLTATAEAQASASAALEGTAAKIIPMPFGDIWLRDTGPIFAVEGGSLVARAFGFNGWGGKYVFDADQSVRSGIADLANTPIRFFDPVLEGGAIDVDGTGRVLTTRQCLLNPNRGAGLTEKGVEAMLAKALGLDTVIWLKRGLEGDHTDGHVDNLARFIGPGRVVTMAPSGEGDPNAGVYKDIKAALEAAGLDVVLVPSPGRYADAGGEIAPASYMNFYIGNAVVVVPTYGTQWDEDAVAIIGREFPTRKTIGLPSNHLLTGGGSFHCITQQQPLAPGA